MGYCTITLNEMRDFLKADKGWELIELPRSREYVFQFKFKYIPGVVVRVYSSINQNDGLARAKGSDAIRVCAFDIIRHCGLVKSSRVLRIDTWRHNLKKRVLSVIELAKARADWRK